MTMWVRPLIGAIVLACMPLAAPQAAPNVQFDLTVSGGAATCLPNATGTVNIQPGNAVDIMTIAIYNMPKKTTFNVFIIQSPNAPFGMAFYHGDVITDGNGVGFGTFMGRLNVESFVVAPGTLPAPQNEPTDASSNPMTNPIQLYHIGLWFDSPDAAAKAGCANTVTPFNGKHNAGIQVLNTADFDALAGPLSFVK